MDLTGKRALITGGARGIGRATALRLSEAGASIAINYVSNEQAARELADQIMAMGGEAITVRADVSEEEDVRQMAEMVGQHWGRIDIVISNAASGGFRPLLNATARNFDATMHTNVRALMFLVQACMPWLNHGPDQRKVIALSSHGSHRALPHYGLIGTSKAALESLIRHWALELGPEGINFNCVLGGLVATDSTTHFPEAERVHAEVNARMLIGPGKRLLAEDVAHVITFLASQESNAIQGQTITVDGGACLHG